MALDIDRIQKNIRSQRKLLKKSPKHPTPKEVHDLRTHSYRIRTALDSLVLNRKDHEQHLLKDLQRLRNLAGKVRDMDVFVVCASRTRLKEEQGCLVQLIEYLGLERYRKARKLRSHMRKHRATLRSRLKGTSKTLEELLTNDQADQLDGEHRISANVMAVALQLSFELGSAATLNRDNLHPYRLKVKQLRYVLQLVNDPMDQGFICKLGEIKDAIGEWHDWEALAAIATDVLTHKENCKVLRELKTTGQFKYQRALSMTKKMKTELSSFYGSRQSTRFSLKTFRDREKNTSKPPAPNISSSRRFSRSA